MAIQTAELSYAIRPKVILKYLGQLLLALAALTLPPLAVALYFQERGMAIRFGLVSCVLAILGATLRKIRANGAMQLNESMVLAALIFLIAPIVMTYPLMASGLHFEDALFESISSITTTGLSINPSEQEATPSYLFARSWIQWYGALAIVVFSLALITQPGIVATIAEIQQDDLAGGMREHSKRLFKIYFLLTIAGIVGTLLLDIGFFDSVLYTLSALATGGFSPYKSSFQSLNWAAQWWITVICFVGAMPLIYFYRKIFRLHSITMDKVQIMALAMMAVITSLILSACLSLIDKMEWLQVLHHAPLLAFSAQTTAGFSTLSISSLDSASKLVLTFCMFIGGSVGSTSGGIKVLRLLITVNILGFILLRTCLPKHAVAEPRLGGRRLEYSEIAEGLLLIIIYFAVIALSWLFFVIMRYDPLASLFEVTSAIGTVGLSAGITDKSLPFQLKGVLCIDMLMGRLEIFAWLVLLFPRTWCGKKGAETT